MAGGRFSNEIVVVGEVGGVTEMIVSSLGRLCPSTTLSAVFNGRPGKMQNQNSAQSKIYSDESVLESESLSLKDKIVVLVYEEDEAIRGQDTPRSKSEEMIEKVAKLIKSRGEDAMPASVVVATSVGSLEETKVEGPAALLSVFQRGTIRQSVAAIKAVSEGLPVSLLTYGSLLDNPAVPFLSPPLLEPKLHPSYKLQSVLMSIAGSNQYAESAECSQSALDGAVTRLVSKQVTHLTAGGKGALPAVTAVVVTSIAGPIPSDKDWDAAFQRVLTMGKGAGSAELIKIEFGSVQKEAAFLLWITNSWFPQALVEADAATILSGSRPVRAVRSTKEDNAISVIWENMDPQTMRPVFVGSLEIRLVAKGEEGANPYLSVRRVSDGKPLQGEGLLVDKLVEGINRNAFKKNFATPK